MAVLWQSSRTFETDLNGHPQIGCEAFFYDAGTSTPLVVYQDSALGTAWNQPVETDANGRWPAVFLPPTQYRIHVNDPGGSTLYDDDNIDPPQAADFVPPDAGSTDPTLLAITGDIKAKHGTSSEAGWVRGNGKSIGNAASGATERANADTSALFQYLWAQDTNLVVSGGRGGTAAGDFAASKKLTLPNYINRALTGLLMGGTDPAILASALIDNSKTNDTLGATVGASTHALTIAELAAHDHGGTTNTTGAHTHNYTAYGSGGVQSGSGAPLPITPAATPTTSAGDHAHTISSQGSGTAHLNMQPSVLVTFYIKL